MILRPVKISNGKRISTDLFQIDDRPTTGTRSVNGQRNKQRMYVLMSGTFFYKTFDVSSRGCNPSLKMVRPVWKLFRQTLSK